MANTLSTAFTCPPTTTTIPDFPPELYRDVISALNFYLPEERWTILRIACTPRFLRDESQRFIFYHNEAIDHIAHDKRDALIRHSQFVQAIFNHPRRLGPFVRTFVQVELACEPGVSAPPVIPIKNHSETVKVMLHNLRYRRLRVRLWELTGKVLPSFVNLESLVMINHTLGATTRTMLSLTVSTGHPPTRLKKRL